MTPPDALDLDSIRALCDAASPGPWSVDEPTQQGVPIRMPPIRQFSPGRPGGKDARTVCCVMGYGREYERHNAAFIAASRTLLPQLCDAVERYRTALTEITERKGPFSLDPLTHAGNCVEAMALIAERALATEDR